MLKKSALFGTSAALAIVLAVPVTAQSGDEIIVTATKRQTTLQDTPVAVSVTTADVIEKARIADIGDLQTVVPTLRVSQLQNSGNTSFSLRGFGNGTNNVGIEPAVGVFIDGVYRSRAAASINNLPNLERVEILPGPQSTLFGKNASGGVISIVTSAPSFERTGYIEAGAGNNNLFSGKAFYTGALNETAAFSLGANFEKADGYFDVEGAEDFNTTDRWGVRGQLLLQPSDVLSLRVIADINGIDEQCCGTSIGDEGPVSTINRTLGFLPSDDDTYAYVANANIDSDNTVQDMGVSLHADYDLNNYTLTSISAVRGNEWTYAADSDYSSRDVLGNVYQDVDTRTFTQEFRLASDFGGDFEYLLGAYYFNETVELDSGVEWGADARGFAEAVSPTFPGTLAGLETFNGLDVGSFFADGTGQDEFFEQDDEAFSLFGTADFDVSDKLTISGGLNYTTVDKNVSYDTVSTETFSQLDLNASPNTLVIGGTANAVYLAGIDDPTSSAYAAFAASVTPALAGTALEGAQFTQTTIDTLNGISAFAPSLAAFQAGFEATVAGAVTAGLQGLQFLNPALNFPNEVETGNSSDDKLTWSVRGNYEVNENINLFAGAATGFKATSWNMTRNTLPFASDQAAIEDAGLDQVNQEYQFRFAEPEESTVYEIGMKARFERGALNVTLFDQTIENFQATIFQGGAFLLSNAEEQSTSGVEFDGVYNATDNLTLTLAGALLDPVYDKFTQGVDQDGNAADVSGQQVPGVHEVSLSGSVTYDHNFASGTTGFVRAEYLYESEAELVDNVPDYLTREVGTLGASAGLTFTNDVSLMLWARNLNNDEYATSAFPTPLISSVESGGGLKRSISVYPNQPRTYGASLRMSF